MNKPIIDIEGLFKNYEISADILKKYKENPDFDKLNITDLNLDICQLKICDKNLGAIEYEIYKTNKKLEKDINSLENLLIKLISKDKKEDNVLDK